MKNSSRAVLLASVVGLTVIAPITYAAKEVIVLVRSGAIDGAATPTPATSEIAPFSFSDVEPVDMVQTASIPAAPAPLVASVRPVPLRAETSPLKSVVSEEVAPKPVQASAEFLKALETLGDGDIAGALEQASALKSAVERRTIQWAAIHFNAGKVDHNTIKAFMAEVPEFASSDVFRTRLEQSLVWSNLSADEFLTELGDQPQTIEGQIVLARALLADGDKAAAQELVRKIWSENFLTRSQEKRVLDSFRSLLDRETHWQRAMHLMMHDRAKGSERLLPFLSKAQATLVKARAAVSRDEADAKAQLDNVDPSMKTNPVYIYSRVQRARQFELWESAAEWLAKAPADVPDAAEWWYERRSLIRKFMDLGEHRLAFEVADGYRDGPEARMVEAHFHAGWIALAFLDDAEAAKRHFSEMTKHTTLPDSISQANYWLGRANSKLGDLEGAQAAFEAAAKFSTVFYGQLALAELGHHGVDIRPEPDARDRMALFEGNSVVQAVRLLAASNKKSMATTLLRQYSNGLQHGGEFLLASKLAQELDAPQLSIAIAATAEGNGVPLDSLAFPHNALPPSAKLGTERAAVFAVARQESMFQIDAESHVGARGLMQLMPGTAKEVAEAVGVDYSPARLVSDASYNALLGSTYLGKQLDRYDGSLVLAAAAYNAGAGNANKWIKAYGDPRDSDVDAVSWVERIPFQETRTYVKRVLGNYLVYRAQMGDARMTLKQALRTIDE
ncbi:lytic transglycosylase domain-containing protein [Devosia submarina]|uniref:lytic transglycosylase domain-containing protein n=1 Tax=Devosia submarina TaxID=1173082 RepID=UPI00130079C8|nr:transglycosylase SLT domain-containing protein [Devosia submarina]